MYDFLNGVKTESELQEYKMKAVKQLVMYILVERFFIFIFSFYFIF